ncbi:hypothetical protein PV325_003801 [Microctonus aethiopoides]|nr:hypothetical protein PV325_003801 [Microctonus aethiopoides]
MSILLTHEDGWIISHLQFINKVYNNVNYNNINCKLRFKEDLFNINSQYLRANQVRKIASEVSLKRDCKKSRKRKRINSPSSSSSIHRQQIQFVQQTLHNIITIAQENGFYTNSISIDYNKQARIASQQFYDDTSYDISEHFIGSNQSNTTIITKIGSNEYVIPENCTFYSYDIRDIHQKLELNCQFDFILMDPPWWNKFIRRNKSFSYKMMHNDELCKIPINNLLSINGIIAIWCTNSAAHFNDIVNVMFPTWGIKFIAKWYWVKVTQSGHVVCDFNYNEGKQPYELLIFGVLCTNQISTIPDNKLLVSVPSAIHSHKPPIAEIIKPYLIEKPNCLEIFARYLLPGWTSWGLEILKFQQLSLYNFQEFSEKKHEIETT